MIRPDDLFGELRSLVQNMDSSPDDVLAFFDAHAVTPAPGQGAWLNYAVDALRARAERIYEPDPIPWVCAHEALERWWNHDALHGEEGRDAIEGLEMLGEESAFGPFGFCAQLLEVFWRHGSEEVMRQTRLPEDLMSYLIAARGRRWSRDPGNAYALRLYDAGVIAHATQNEAEMWTQDREDHDPQPGAWLTIGWWSDKHLRALCCDSESALFGQVHDFHDGHPWLNGEDFGWLEADTFLEYVQALQDGEGD